MTSAEPTTSDAASTVEPPVAATPPARRSLAVWLVPLGLLALAAIGILWAIPRPVRFCPAIYPAPPECAAGGDPSTVMPFLVLIVLLYAAIVACGVLVPARRRALVLGLLAGGLGLVFIVGTMVALGAANGPVYYS